MSDEPAANFKDRIDAIMYAHDQVFKGALERTDESHPDNHPFHMSVRGWFGMDRNMRMTVVKRRDEKQQEDKPVTGKTIDQVRNWLAGQTVEGLPHRDLPKPVTDEEDEEDDELVGELTDKRKLKHDQLLVHQTAVGNGTVGGKKRGRYTATKDGKDAKLHFGRFAEKLISEVEDQTYLQWLLKEDFPESLKTIVRLHVKPLKRR